MSPDALPQSVYVVISTMLLVPDGFFQHGRKKKQGSVYLKYLQFPLISI